MVVVKVNGDGGCHGDAAWLSRVEVMVVVMVNGDGGYSMSW